MDPEVENASGSNPYTSKKCPVCKLINPPSAQRCDCGYDFISNTQESPYFIPKYQLVESLFSKQKIPKDMNLYFIVLASLIGFSAVIFLLTSNYIRFFATLFWGLVDLWLCKKLLRKKDWARIALAVVTFPLGLFIGLSTDVKLFVQHKK